MNTRLKQLRTIVEINKSALRNNIKQFRKIISSKTKIMAVVKSNAYGHGLWQISYLCEKFGVNWLAVDSITEAIKLREKGIHLPILVLGATLPFWYEAAREMNISLTVSNFESLKNIAKIKYPPKIHLKIDTGMHRQGFFPQDLKKVIKEIVNCKLKIENCLEGVYTHFASAKDRTYPFYTIEQIKKFKKAIEILNKAGFKKLIKHTASSGAAILYPESHFDMIRVGIGLYGYWPTKEARLQHDIQFSSNKSNHVELKPVLSWKTVIGEIKNILAGSYLGYDLTERVNKPSKIAVLPVGYWHGFDRGFSSIGEVLVAGQKARVLGRVSMDMIVVDITNLKSQISNLKNSEVVLVGKSGREELTADDLAGKIGTINYEILTRINPLIERIII